MTLILFQDYQDENGTVSRMMRGLLGTTPISGLGDLWREIQDSWTTKDTNFYPGAGDTIQVCGVILYRCVGDAIQVCGVILYRCVG